MPNERSESPRSLPSVDRVLRILGDQPVASRDILVSLTRSVIADHRDGGAAVTADDVAALVAQRLEDLARPRLASVVNGTGVLLHTNLGRAPVSRATAEAMAAAAAGYVPLEIDPDTNARGGRMDEVSDLMRLLCGAERTLVVNNNSAALLLTLAGIASGREVIVSRGEAVEIGGGFRVPDVVVQGGCRLVDVGTTNKTRPNDYRAAVGPLTGAMLKVHPSNFVVAGFTEEASTAELSAIGRETGVPVVDDIGSGALIDPVTFGLRAEPTFQSSLTAGADLVTASGDKLLGGPQAGLICGDADLVGRIERHPLARAVRADKATLAGVAATLRHYVAGEAVAEIPVWRMIATPIDALSARAERLAAATGALVADLRSTVGGGSLPGEELPSVGVVVASGAEDVIAARLRSRRPRVFGRIAEGRLLIDLRTVHPDQDDALVTAILAATASPGG